MTCLGIWKIETDRMVFWHGQSSELSFTRKTYIGLQHKTIYSRPVH